MRLDKRKLILYAVTDRTCIKDKDLKCCVEEAIKGGATFIQLREKKISDESYLVLAEEIRGVCNKYGIPFVVNDNPYIAAKAGADGVHVGQGDTDAQKARAIIGEDRILGVSVQTVKQAIDAEKAGADYLGVGSVFSTTSKDDAEKVSIETLKSICGQVRIPVVAIGGINADNVRYLKESGIHGVSVISAVLGAEDIAKATRKLKSAVQEVIRHD